MKRQLINSLVASALLAGNAHAYQASGQERAPGLEQWQERGLDEWTGSDSEYRVAWQGAGIGALAGALLAGPPGLIAGAAGGALAGRSAGLESDLHDARRQLEQQKHEQLLTEGQLAQLTQRLESAKSAYRQQLDAIAGGFVHRIRFRTGKATLEPDALHDLSRLAAALKRVNGLRVVVHAHADRRGGAAMNLALSAARAEAVSQQLTRHGVEPERIARQLHGEAEAGYPVDDPEGLGYDRQVVIRLLPVDAS